MKNVLMIAPSDLPIPAVRGGAVETGIDQLLAENERNSGIHIDVVSFFDDEAYKQSKKYKNTDFLFYEKKRIDSVLCFCAKAINKIFRKLHIKITVNSRPLFIRYIRKNLVLQKYDAILIKNAVNYILPLSKSTSGNLFLQLHNDFLNSDTYNALKIVKKCEAIIANSEYIKKRALTIPGLSKNKVLLNMNCLDERSFCTADRKKREELLKKHDIEKDDKIILFSGRLIAEKGVKELLSAVGKIEEGKKWKLLIAGAKWFSTNKKDKYIRELELLSRKISKNIIFLGYVPHSEINYYNSVADVVVVPSIWEEPAGRVALEAAAVGTPVIVSDSGGLKEYIDRSNSIVVKKDDNFVKNLKKSICEVLFEDRFSSKKSASSLIDFAKQFSAKRYYEEIMKYMGVLEK